MSYFHNIVVALDFSKTSNEALQVARQLAVDHGARLYLLHVVADVRQTPAILEAPGAGFDQIQQQWVGDALERLSALAPKGLAAVEAEAIVGSPVAQTIANYAAAKNADLIVLGTHGYGPVKRLLLGSVCDQLLRSTPCPVLTVPPGSVPGAAETVAPETVAASGHAG
jgi:nucleotide-binding universal stress UspA family protein